MIERYAQIVERFPVWLIDDGLAEDDWAGWADLTRRLGDGVQLVGDDIFVTNPAIIKEAISRGIGNAALIKVNQVGTVTETLAAIATCRQGEYAQFVSHRSGETSDTFIADLAASSGCGALKTGAPARGARSTTGFLRSRPPSLACPTGFPPQEHPLTGGRLVGQFAVRLINGDGARR
jgi:enolase